MPSKTSHIQKYLHDNYNIKPIIIQRINSGVINSNYLIKTQGNSFVFKIYNLSDEKDVAFELSIINYLSQKKFPCPRIVPDVRDRLFAFYHTKPAVLLRYIPGEMISSITQGEMKRIGAGVGLLHKLLQNFDQPIKRVTWEVRDIEGHIKFESKKIVEKQYPDAENFTKYVASEFQKLEFPGDLPKGITHQDVKPENIIIDSQGNISFIDFNDCYRGSLIFDVMTTIIWTCFKHYTLDVGLFKSYLYGYMKERPFTQLEKNYCYQALRFRLLRETFVWPMRFSPKVAYTKSETFLRSYKSMVTDVEKYQEIFFSVLNDGSCKC